MTASSRSYFELFGLAHIDGQQVRNYHQPHDPATPAPLSRPQWIRFCSQEVGLLLEPQDIPVGGLTLLKNYLTPAVFKSHLLSLSIIPILSILQNTAHTPDCPQKIPETNTTIHPKSHNGQCRHGRVEACQLCRHRINHKYVDN